MSPDHRARDAFIWLKDHGDGDNAARPGKCADAVGEVATEILRPSRRSLQ